MDADRKYKQRGYMEVTEPAGNGAREDRPRIPGPRLPIDITGPRLPRLVQSVVASRCYSCSVTLPDGVDFGSPCPRCGVALHCCKQCKHFEPSTRFQCLKPVPARLAPKDTANQCEMFSSRVTVARDAAPAACSLPAPRALDPQVKPSEARAAFDNLFKK
jgi:hypothetical protein